MITGAVPPGPMSVPMRQYDATWNGQKHRNVCVKVVGSRKVPVDGLPAYDVYYASPDADVLARTREFRALLGRFEGNEIKIEEVLAHPMWRRVHARRMIWSTPGPRSMRMLL